VGSIELEPSAELEDLIDGDEAVFIREIAATIWPAIAAHVRQDLDVRRQGINGVGVITVGPRGPSDAPNAGPRVSIHNVHEWTIERAAARVVGRIDEASRQLAATDAELRAAVVWGGLDHFHAVPWPMKSLVESPPAATSTAWTTPGSSTATDAAFCSAGRPRRWCAPCMTASLRRDDGLAACGLLHRAVAAS
jgi:hypothetical protein